MLVTSIVHQEEKCLRWRALGCGLGALKGRLRKCVLGVTPVPSDSKVGKSWIWWKALNVAMAVTIAYVLHLSSLFLCTEMPLWWLKSLLLGVLKDKLITSAMSSLSFMQGADT